MPRGHGFDPSVCEGCPKRQTDTKGSPCSICGCPTEAGLLMDRLGMPPAECPRVEQHKDE
jgi:hypothetical protein